MSSFIANQQGWHDDSDFINEKGPLATLVDEQLPAYCTLERTSVSCSHNSEEKHDHSSDCNEAYHQQIISTSTASEDLLTDKPLVIRIKDRNTADTVPEYTKQQCLKASETFELALDHVMNVVQNQVESLQVSDIHEQSVPPLENSQDSATPPSTEQPPSYAETEDPWAWYTVKPEHQQRPIIVPGPAGAGRKGKQKSAEDYQKSASKLGYGGSYRYAAYANGTGRRHPTEEDEDPTDNSSSDQSGSGGGGGRRRRDDSDGLEESAIDQTNVVEDSSESHSTAVPRSAGLEYGSSRSVPRMSSHDAWFCCNCHAMGSYVNDYCGECSNLRCQECETQRIAGV